MSSVLEIAQDSVQLQSYQRKLFRLCGETQTFVPPKRIQVNELDSRVVIPGL